ncbi:TatA/E family protein of Tat protein translocase [Hydrogenispora ethanolica]|uniref:Sec-independent protein translocase protein TatA n=1 Tax=Hydrogenispora ethanolica TaxID=1082276 RepID=A0A4R1QVT9_HYDET|nr:TatA/E family protein of Tat protein translocase [Hydrogenispora ethanolica]
MFGLGGQELLLILVIVLIFFGAEKIPQLAKALGKGMGEFRKAQNDLKQEINSAGEILANGAAAEPASARTDADTPAETAATVICPACQGRNLAGARYCSQCGKLLGDSPKCSVCQRPWQPEEKFCPKCGERRP